MRLSLRYGLIVMIAQWLSFRSYTERSVYGLPMYPYCPTKQLVQNRAILCSEKFFEVCSWPPFMSTLLDSTLLGL